MLGVKLRGIEQGPDKILIMSSFFSFLDSIQEIKYLFPFYFGRIPTNGGKKELINYESLVLFLQHLMNLFAVFYGMKIGWIIDKGHVRSGEIVL